MSSNTAIRIAGAGISGLTAAINLALNGFDVEVFERKKDAGGRFGGDMQGLENWTTPEDVLDVVRSYNLALDFDATPLPPLVLTDGRGGSKPFRFKRPVCYLVKRGTGKGTLDQSLKDQALRLGVRIRFGQALPPEQAHINATGPNTREVFAVDKGYVFQTDLPDQAIAIVNDKAAYKGYAYLLVVNGYGCLCTVLFDRFQEVNRCLAETRRIIESLVPLDLSGSRTVGGIGSIARETMFRKGDTLLVGEAAGIQDFLWGFGIRTAMHSGYLAAQCLVNGWDYQQQASACFPQRIQSGIVTRYLYHQCSNLRFGYALMGKWVRERSDPGYLLSKAYGFGRLHRRIYPIALRALQKRYPDLRL
jgi:flavin-dependent dehydrogenase